MFGAPTVRSILEDELDRTAVWHVPNLSRDVGEEPPPLQRRDGGKAHSILGFLDEKRRPCLEQLSRLQASAVFDELQQRLHRQKLNGIGLNLFEELSQPDLH